jgi:periplasmic divalent cation tolerance protein
MNASGLPGEPDQDLCEVVLTAPDPHWMRDFARRLVDARLAAAVHVVDRTGTVYRWQGDVQEATEAKYMTRTRVALVPAILDRVRREHPYDVPSVIALPIIAVSPDYAAWVLAQTVNPAVAPGAGAGAD